MHQSVARVILPALVHCCLELDIAVLFLWRLESNSAPYACWVGTLTRTSEESPAVLSTSVVPTCKTQSCLQSVWLRVVLLPGPLFF